MTNSSGVRCYDADFPPYGTENSYVGSCSPIYKFSGYERDTETGLDYAVNRYYNSRIGRFMTPDPSGIASASLGNPQSLNRYAYVTNNPVGLADPLGEDPNLPGADYNVTCWENGFQNGVHNNVNCPAPGNGWGDMMWGNDMLDAIAGAPGTYLTVDMNGGLGFGFSVDL
jgi:RHS repeat-associated protein